MAERKKKSQAEEAAGGNINQVRDILIGPFQREQEARLDALERTIERHKKEAAEAASRLEEKLSKKLDELTKSSKEADKALAKDLDKAQKQLAADLEALEKRATEHLNTLRSDLELELARIRDEKAGKEDLGDYFMELGMRLKGETSLEKIESTLSSMRSGDAKA